MTDPRNIAHDKRVSKTKKHQGGDLKAAMLHAAQPGRKPRIDPDQDAYGHGPDSDEPVDRTESGEQS